MCAYNKINGLAACLHGDLQNDLLRDKWKFQGAVVSDCDAVQDVISPQEVRIVELESIEPNEQC